MYRSGPDFHNAPMIDPRFYFDTDEESPADPPQDFYRPFLAAFAIGVLAWIVVVLTRVF